MSLQLYDRKTPTLSSYYDPTICFDWIHILIRVSNDLIVYPWCPIVIYSYIYYILNLGKSDRNK